LKLSAQVPLMTLFLFYTACGPDKQKSKPDGRALEPISDRMDSKNKGGGAGNGTQDGQKNNGDLARGDRPESQTGEKDDESPEILSFSVEDILLTARKASMRFERLAIPNAKIVSIRSWKTSTYSWAHLTYQISTPELPIDYKSIILACHFHGKVLACHRKNEAPKS